MSYFTGKVIWITGASAGIGEALTYELAKKGDQTNFISKEKK